MHESLFSNKITVTTPTGLNTVKIDIIKMDLSIEVRMIDTSSIFSLFVCSISSSDFYILKRDQEILVDYDRFIQILISLFHSTVNSKCTATFQDNTLRFIENAEFRNICKLELKFTKPEDSQFKRYLNDLLTRMENDNIKLIKENSILRDKCINGDRAMADRLRFAESDNAELKRRYDLLMKDQMLLEGKLNSKEDEIGKLSNRIYSIENESTQIKYELEKYQRDNSLSFKEQLKAKEGEVEDISKEIATANELIKRLRQENGDLRSFKADTQSGLKQEKEQNEMLAGKVEELNKKLGSIESKYKKLKEETKEKSLRIEELNAVNSSISKKLENAQNVYNHFYSKKVEDHQDNFSDTFSLRPESPSPR